MSSVSNATLLAAQLMTKTMPSRTSTQQFSASVRRQREEEQRPKNTDAKVPEDRVEISPEAMAKAEEYKAQMLAAVTPEEDADDPTDGLIVPQASPKDDETPSSFLREAPRAGGGNAIIAPGSQLDIRI